VGGKELFGVWILVPAAVITAYADEGHATGMIIAAVAVWRGRRYWRQRRFRREYVSPTLAAMSPALGLDDSQVRLHVDPDARQPHPPAGEAPVASREVDPPAVRRVRRAGSALAARAGAAGAWAVQAWARPVTSKRELLRRPREDAGPRIELRARTPYLTSEQRLLVSSIVKAKIPAGDLVESWNQIGVSVRAIWTVRKRPPAAVGLDHLLAHLPRLKEWEFYIGEAAGGVPVVISLKDDSPHIAVSAGSGAGKSVLAQLIAVQVLRRGGRVLILDRKGSHRWAVGVAGVDYCTKPVQMHEALIRAAEVR
jgi:hypothetical protein